MSTDTAQLRSVASLAASLPATPPVLMPLASEDGMMTDAFGNPFALDPESDGAIIEKHAWCQMCGPAKTKCSTICTVRNGRWVHVDGNPLASNNGIKDGHTLCVKGNASLQVPYDPYRILYPMKRVGKKGEGKFVRISWDEAFEMMADKLLEAKEQYGPESYGVLSPQAYNVLWTLGRRFLNVHGSPNYLHSGICARQRAVSRWVSIGKADANPAQLDKTKLYVIWGANPENSAINQGKPRARLNAMENGLTVVDIRPLMDPLASKADIWLPIRPGTDGSLALAFLNVIITEDLYDHEFVEEWCLGFDELADHVKEFTPEWASEKCGIPAEQIREVGRMMGTMKPMGILTGNGIGDQQRDGNWTAIAINLIPAITGNLDIPGGGGGKKGAWKPVIKPKPFNILTDRLPESDEDRENGWYAGMSKLVAPEMPRWFQHPDNWESGPNSAYFKGLMSTLTQEPYPLRFVLAQATNPFGATRQPKEVAKALEALDFYVVHDVRWNTSCNYADLVLPAATHYESNQQFATKNGPNGTFIGLNQKIAEPMGQSISDWDFYIRFADAAGYGDDFWNGDMDKSLSERLDGSGVTLEELRNGDAAREGILFERAADDKPGEATYKNYDKLFAHLPEGKVQLNNALLGGKPNVLDTGDLGSLPVYVGPPEGIAETPELTDEYPFILSDVHAYRLCMHSYYNETPLLHELQTKPWLLINPATAEKLGVEEGDWLRVESPHGWIKLTAKLFEGVAPEVVMTRRGWWRPSIDAALPGNGAFDGGSDSSVLFASDIAEFDPFHSGMAKQTLVKIEKLEDEIEPYDTIEVPPHPDNSALLDAFSTASGMDDKPYTAEQAYISFDEKRCIECWSCEVACKQWHETVIGEHGRCWINEEDSGVFPNVTRRFSFIHCLQCAEPECERVCPTGAITKRASDGVVLVDEDACIACKKCLAACPYNIPEFSDTYIYKCDMCNSIAGLAHGMPKCVATCPTQALTFHPADGATIDDEAIEVRKTEPATADISDAPVLPTDEATNLTESYDLLGNLLLFEPSADLLQKLADAPGDAPAVWQSYAKQLAQKLADGNSSLDDEVVELSAEFASLLLGMSANPVRPYESVYAVQNGLLMGSVRDEVVRAYASAGLQELSGLRLPEDHLGIELSFMAQLCKREANADADAEAAQEAANIRAQFTDQHLRTWVPAFCADLEKRAQSDFYKGLAQLIAESIGN